MLTTLEHYVKNKICLKDIIDKRMMLTAIVSLYSFRPINFCTMSEVRNVFLYRGVARHFILDMVTKLMNILKALFPLPKN